MQNDIYGRLTKRLLISHLVFHFLRQSVIVLDLITRISFKQKKRIEKQSYTFVIYRIYFSIYLHNGNGYIFLQLDSCITSLHPKCYQSSCETKNSVKVRLKFQK